MVRRRTRLRRIGIESWAEVEVNAGQVGVQIDDGLGADRRAAGARRAKRRDTAGINWEGTRADEGLETAK